MLPHSIRKTGWRLWDGVADQRPCLSLGTALFGLMMIWLFFLSDVARADSFTVDDIEVLGVQRIEPGTVFNYLPVKVGDSFDTARSAEVIRALIKTGFFNDVQLLRRGDVLVIQVKERPAIAELKFDGNKDIKDEDLEKALKGVGIAKGRVFNRSVLERLENELRQQYFARGKYNVRIDVTVNELPRNRVDINIDISEGKPAKIKRITLVGNESYKSDDITDEFSSGKAPWWNPFSSRDQYAKAKLAGDLEKLRSYYLDRGYLKFNVDSTQVSITPDNRDIYVTINLEEGDKYVVKEVRLAGEFVVPEEELRRLTAIHAGEIFSREKVVKTTDNISRRLGDDGYAFANINPIPEVDEQRREVSLTFFVDPGQRAYVRRINFFGNTGTQDEVFRREMRQMEGGWYSLDKINLSRRRIQRLSYVESVDIKTDRVSGSDDLVDLNVTIKERRSGSFSVGVGFSQAQGILFNLGLNQDNFLGTGRRVSLRFDNSRVSTIYSLSYVNPYFTINGVSAGFHATYSDINAAEANVSSYTADTLDVGVNLGAPITEVDTIRGGLSVENIKIDTNSNTPEEIFEFIAQNGNEYLDFPFTATFVHDTRNKSAFATRGNLQRLTGEVTIPGSDLEYYKTGYRLRQYIPIRSWLTGMFFTNVAFGESYGDDGDLPFFEKYYAGGIRSVRGYKTNTLGPRDSTGRPFGGNFRTVASVENIFPVPFVKGSENMRLSVFVDAGNVFAQPSDWDYTALRASVGAAFSWISPLGALTFSYAVPINDQPGDELEAFQFNVGTLF